MLLTSVCFTSFNRIGSDSSTTKYCNDVKHKPACKLAPKCASKQTKHCHSTLMGTGSPALGIDQQQSHLWHSQDTGQSDRAQDSPAVAVGNLQSYALAEHPKQNLLTYSKDTY